MNKKGVIRAVDVGFGNTKFIEKRVFGVSLACNMFPSLTPAASNNDLGEGAFQNLNTVTISVNNVTYEVGKDVRNALPAKYSRETNAQFAKSDAYMALLRGALNYMDEDEIDMLVVGLPVSRHKELHAQLKADMIGEHHVGNGRVVNVRDAWVLPQPIGGFFDYAVQHEILQKAKNEMNLLIDPGYYTLDWVVARGVQINRSRSGSYEDGGMHAFLRVIAEGLGSELKTEIKEFSKIDEALVAGKHPTLFGVERDISKYLPLAHKRVREAVADMVKSVGDGHDIDNIILVGGGADVFKKEVEKAFPQHKVEICKNPIFANVRGFQLAGEARFAELQVLATRAAKKA